MHDPRICSTCSSWLPHAETLVNSVGISANVDKLYHQQLSAVYNCSPIYNYIPKKRWKSDPFETFHAWRDLYAYVCNLDENSSTWDYNTSNSTAINALGFPKHNTFLKDNRSGLKSELVKVLIALEFRKHKIGQSYAYLPTHLFCGELCMVLQTRVFRVNSDFKQSLGNSSYIYEMEFDLNNIPHGSDEIIVAREIAFGPVGDPGIRQVSVWFNVDANFLVPCTTQQAKRHKRSRHRLRKDREKDRTSSLVQRTSSIASDDENSPKIPESLEHSPFFNYQPIDNDAFDLVTNILIHRSKVLLLWILNPHKGDIITSLRAFEHQIQSNFESQRRHWMTWAWPINKGRGRIDDETDVPPVNGEYKFTTDYNGDENSNPCVVYFHGVFDGSKPDIVPTSSKEAVFKIWEAFIENMEVIQGKEKNVSLFYI